MLRKLVFAIVALLSVLSAANAQDDDPALLRIMQLSFLTDVSATVDVQIDGQTVFQNISFPFTTDYVELAPGTHSLTTVVSDATDSAASTSLMLESGHNYSVVVEGDYSSSVTFVAIDETDLLPEPTGSTAIVTNLTPYPITDVYLNDEMVAASIAVESYSAFALPAEEFTLSGMLGDGDYSETFNPHSNTLFLVAARAIPSGDAQIIYQRSTHLTVAGYLQAISDGAQFSQVAGLIASAGLLDSLTDDSQYTLFLPTNQSFESLEAPTDAEEVRELLSGHITAQNLPPYRLPDYDKLTMLSGNITSIDYTDTNSGYWEINGMPILWDLRLANGVIYAIDGLLSR